MFSERFISFMKLLQRETTPPEPLSTWHLVSLGCMLSALLFLILFFRNASDKTMRLIVLIGWILLVIPEILRQLVYSVTIIDNTVLWEYEWETFPFQFCSSPLYTLPFVFLLRDCALRRCVIAFLATFSLLAGCVVLVFPSSVASIYESINIQTMLHHGLQIVLGAYLLVYSRRIRAKSMFGALLIFLALFCTAIALNELVHDHIVENGLTNVFNMFYISPYHYADCELPIIVFLRQYFDHNAFINLYAVAFSVGAFIVYGIERALYFLIRKKSKKKEILL